MFKRFTKPTCLYLAILMLLCVFSVSIFAYAEGYDTYYANDPVVNKFINEYNDAYEEDITDIEQGNIRTKYFGNLKGTYLEMINANDAYAEAFTVKINCSENHDILFQVFGEMARILEPSLTDEALQEGIHALSETGYMVENLQVGNTLTVTFVPSGRIDIGASDYKGD